MATAKLRINLAEGLIEAEGEEAFVTKVYEDFKDRLEGLQMSQARSKNEEAGAGTGGGAGAGSHRPASRRARTPVPAARKSNGEGGKSVSSGGISRYEPKRDPDLDLGELADFIGRFEPKGNPERYLLYAWFLKETLEKDSCSIDHLYSCFLEMKDDIPVRMGQNLIDTRARNGFLKFTSPHDITITAVGINHFNKKIARKAAE